MMRAVAPTLGLRLKVKGKSIVAVLGFGFLILLWLFVGLYCDREWGTLHLFVKYRPSPKVFFYAPLGEADRSDIPGREGYLTKKQEKEEQAIVDFVEQHWLRVAR